VNEALAKTVVPFMHDNFPEKNGILQQDGARPHTARVTQQFVTDYNISLLNWASMSPDMSPIEHVWDELKIRVYTRPHPPVNVQQLKDAAIKEWNAIPQAFIANLVQSMRHRCVALLNAPGGFKVKGGYIMTLKGVVNDSLFMPKTCKMTNKGLIFHIVFFNWCEQT